MDHLEGHENSPKYSFTEHPKEIKYSSCFVGRNGDSIFYNWMY